MAPPKPLPPIIIKKKGGHGGHHGGAWKVAYADFVTAMMALFIVLWLMNSSKKIQEAVGGYFKDPKGTAAMLGSEKKLKGQNETVIKEDMEKLKEELQLAIKQMPDINKIKDQIEITITNEGLRIELLESAKGTFFDSGSAKISNSGEELIGMLGGEFGKLPNNIAIEGHTDSKPYAEGSNYGNWELSSDRANAARRLLQQHGIGENQVSQVRGFADQRLRKKNNPLDPSNRRISLIVQYRVKHDADKGDEAVTPEAGAADSEKAAGGEIKPKEPEAKAPEAKPPKE